MTDHDDRPDDQKVAKWTFWATAILAILYVGSIFAFILYR
jgi:hypothetical protein